MGNEDDQPASSAPEPSGQVPNQYEGVASQDDLDTATRAIKEVQTTNRLIIIVLFAAAIAIEIAVIASISAAIISDTNSRDNLKVQVQELNAQVQILNGRIK